MADYPSKLDAVPVLDEMDAALSGKPRFDLGNYLENLSIGLGQGATSQLEGIKQMAEDPIGTLRSIYELGRYAVQNPGEAAKGVAGYVKEGVTGGPLSLGQFIGENVGPGMMSPKPSMRRINNASPIQNVIYYPELSQKGSELSSIRIGGLDIVDPSFGRPLYSLDDVTYAQRKLSRAELEDAIKTGVFGLPESGETKHGVGKKWWSPADESGVFGREWNKGGSEGATVRVPMNKFSPDAPIRIEDVEILDPKTNTFIPIISSQ